MASDPLAAWPRRRTLRDTVGRPALVYSEADDRFGRRWADGAWRPPTASVVSSAEVARRRLAGWALSTNDPELVAALRDRGSRVVRHAESMTHDLADVPERPVAGFEVVGLSPATLTARAPQIGDLAWRAYQPGHGDHDWADASDAADGMRAVSDGEVLGPMMDASRIALDQSHQVIGACLVVHREGPPPHGGPWVLDVFRDPRPGRRGVGAALIASSLHALAAESAPALGLVVTRSNSRASRVYRGLGFVGVDESWTLHLPT